MPDIHTHTRNATLTQQGAWALLGWVDWPIFNESFLHPTLTQGMRFQLHTSMTAEKPRIRALTLNLSATINPFVPGGTAVGEVWVALQTLVNSEDMTHANRPYALPADLPGTGWITWGYDDGTGWSNPTTPSTISIPLGISVTDPVTGTVLYDLSSQALVLENAAANGYINLGVDIVSTPLAGAFVTPTLAITELDFFTGVAGSMGRERGDSRVRVARDSRFGMPTWTDELVEDEFIEGLWVRAANKDPEDQYREYVPNPHEGVRDDDVPLE